MTYGTFDMFHQGHLRLLERAKALGDYLIVGVTDENYDRSRGKLNVVENTETRMEAIKALDFVDKVILETSKKQKAEDMVKYNVDIFAIGDDWIGTFDYLNEFTHVEYLARTKGISSTLLRQNNFDIIELGIVGLGSDTTAFIDEATHVPNLNIKRIYSPDLAALKQYTEKSTHIDYGHDNYDDFLDTDIVAVYIDTTLEQHYPLIKKALMAKKHVLCENPLALHKSELRELLSLAKKEEVLLLSALRTAFLPAFNQLLSELDKGLIGDVKEVRATRTTLYKEKDYPDNFMAQGATNILSSYPSLLVNKILGKSKDITFFDQGTEGYDVSNLIISKHKGGAIGISNVATGIKSEGDAVISGTKGYVYIPEPWWITKQFHVRFEDEHKSQTFKYEFDGCGLRYMIAEFASLIQRGERKSQMLSPQDMISINRVLLEYNERKFKELKEAE
ncbi:adenylyltransferase/cytidyltransferase family protein [Lentisphaera profundi]|uniref:Adenylyltransferase/cytidyltransferase family protein n=1 Tax=Lentisphaera profundi TaxID=1658616 RepID=A0ABY7VVX3_9BACT|nr:Gfo/Idh/MocA family oxidoreductase [Lentisphaera profundi]WDE97433.1 adenylyltransferase/cytidyltransferase family protein [Lentisphaera profundi]